MKRPMIKQALNGEPSYANIPLKIQGTSNVMLLGFENQTELDLNLSMPLYQLCDYGHVTQPYVISVSAPVKWKINSNYIIELL